MPAQYALTDDTSSTNKQLAEVSGWDAQSRFFVEVADLDCSEAGKKTVSLCHHLRNGSLVFVRLLNVDGQRAGGGAPPTAHESQDVQPPDFTGKARVSLVPSRPRAARRRSDRMGSTRI